MSDDPAADVVMGDTDIDDAYADGGVLDADALAEWLHELRFALVALANADGAGLDPLRHFGDLADVDVAFARDLAAAIVADRAHNVLAMHDVLRRYDPTIAEWQQLTAAERTVATGVAVELADWLDREGTTWAPST